MATKRKAEKHSHHKTPVKKETERVPRWWLLVVVALTVVVYLPSLSGGFVWDDARYIENNPLITTINLKELFTRYVMGNYHPLTMLTYAVEYQLFGLEPAGYHAVNLVLHSLNTVLVFYAIFLLGNRALVALIAALLFGLHPLHVESVAWASELKDLLYTFFFLGSYIFYLKYLKEPAKKFLLLSLLLFVCSLLSKGMAVSLPVVLLLTDFVRGRRFTLPVILEKLPYFLLALIFGVVAVYAQKSSEAIQEIARFPFFYRIAFASYGFVMYLFKSILPLQLSAFYPYPVKSGEALPALYYIFPVLALGIVALVALSLRKSRKVLMGLGFFAATVFLVLQLLPVGDAVMADRYSYVPSIGLFYLAGEGVYWLWQNRRRSLAIGLVSLFALFFSIQTFARTRVWNNGLSLWTDVIEKHDNVPVAYNNRGGAYTELKQYPEALADYNKAIELRPGFYDAYNNRGLLLSDLQRKQEALTDYNKAVEFGRDKPEVYSNRGLLLMDLGRNPEARVDFDRAIQLKPDYSQAYYNRGLLSANEGKKEQAFADYTRAIQLNPGYTEAYINRGVLLHNENKLDEALVEYSKAIQLQPGNPQVNFNRGLVMQAKKRNDEAIADFTRAIELKADYGAAYYSRGMLYINSGRKNEGCQDLQSALKSGYAFAAGALGTYCR